MMALKKGDIYWLLGIAFIVWILVNPSTHVVFVSMTNSHPYIIGFLKFMVLATMGELLAIRIATGEWNRPVGLIYRSLIWGFLGMVIVLIFGVFASGIMSAQQKGLLPGKDVKILFAFFTSASMNMTFAPTMMAFHRITDTYIDMKSEMKDVGLDQIVERIDWKGFIGFVLLKTIPFFWIPAHTITFMLKPEYRVLAAAMLSIALGAILSFAKKKQKS